MRFWTIQSDKVVNIIEKEGVFYPDTNKSRYAMQGKNHLRFYRWLLNCFNEVNHTTFDGVIYAFAELAIDKPVEFQSFDLFKKSIRDNEKIIWAIWKCFDENYKILEIEFSEPINPLYIDINDFQVIMPPQIVSMPEAPDLKEALSQGKLIKTRYSCNLLQAHLPYINKKDIVNIHPFFDI